MSTTCTLMRRVAGAAFFAAPDGGSDSVHSGCTPGLDVGRLQGQMTTMARRVSVQAAAFILSIQNGRVPVRFRTRKQTRSVC